MIVVITSGINKNNSVVDSSKSEDNKTNEKTPSFDVENFKEMTMFDDISHNILSIYRSTLRLQIMAMIYHYPTSTDEIENLYKVYKESKGNGYITQLVSDWRNGKNIDVEPNLSPNHISAILEQKELNIQQIIEK